MVLLNRFGRTRDLSIQSYDFIDVSTGQAFVVYYGSDCSDGTYLMLIDQVYSENKYTRADITSGNYTKLIDIDFDIYFKFPKIIEGTTVVNVPFNIYCDANNQVWGKCRAVIKRVNLDSTEENLVTTSYSTELTRTSTGDSSQMMALKATIPRTKIKGGEYLRLTIEGWGKQAGGTCKVSVGHDPKNREVTSLFDSSNDVPTILMFPVPFVVDV